MDEKSSSSNLMNVPFGYAYHKIIVDERGKPTDYEFLDVNPAFERITGLKAKEIIGKTVYQVLPGIREDDFDWVQYYGDIALDGGEGEFEQYSIPLHSWYKVQVCSDQKYYFSTVFIDITAQKSLADIAAIFNNFSAQTIDLQYVTDKARELSGAAYAMLSKFDENGRDFSTIAFSGMNKPVEIVISILGFDPRGKKWDYEPLRQKKIDNQKTTVFQKLTDLTGTVFPKKNITLLCDTLNIGQVAVVKTTRENTMLGDFTLFFKRGSQLKNREIIETYADLTGMLMSRIDEERKVRIEQTRLKTITENMSDFVWESDLQFINTYTSPSVYRVLGFSIEEYMSRTLAERLSPESIQIALPILQEELEKENDPHVNKSRTRLIELEYYKKDGSIIPMESHIGFVRDENVKPIGLRGVSRNISERKRTEEALQKAKDDLQTISDNMLDLVAVTDMQGNFRFAGSSHKILGYEIEYLIGKNVMDFVHPDDLPGVQLKFTDFITNQKSTADATYRNRCADGSYLWLETIGTLISDNHGNPEEILFNTRDITERKRTEEQLRNLSEMQLIILRIATEYINMPQELVNKSINNSLREIGEFVRADRVYIFEYDWINNVCNNTYEWCYGGIHPEIANLQNVSLENVDYWVEAHKNGKEISIEDVMRLPLDDGVRQILEPQGVKSVLALPMMKLDQCIGFIGFDAVRKIHKFSEQEKILLKIFSEMVGNIGNRKELERSLVQAKEKAEESDRLKSAFLANMSHEIRTPMNGILGFAGLLNRPDLKSENRQKYIEIIEQSGKRMLNIINDIVDISKIEAGLMKPDMKETNVNAQIEYVYNFFKPEAEAKKIKLSFKNALPAAKAIIITDREKVYAIVTNLVKNAIKYTPEGSIEFGYHLKKHDASGELEFYVKDTGIGIPKDRQKAIFERFVQADVADTRVFEGAGLGLAINKSYLEMLGGNIWVESEEGKGSTFYFTLPYNVAPAIETTGEQQTPPEERASL